MKKIGEILIENGSITRDQLEKALTRQKNSAGKLLGTVLIEMGFVTEEDIVIALSTQFNVPYLSIKNVTFNKTTSTLIPQELIQKYTCVPLNKIGNLLTVVMADPTNEQAIREIEASTKCKVQVFTTTTSEILAAIQKYFHISIVAMPEIGEGLSRASSHSRATQVVEEKTAQKI